MSYADLTRAKWKLSLALPNSDSTDQHERMLLRQYVMLQTLQKEDFASACAHSFGEQINILVRSW